MYQKKHEALHNTHCENISLEILTLLKTLKYWKSSLKAIGKFT